MNISGSDGERCEDQHLAWGLDASNQPLCLGSDIASQLTAPSCSTVRPPGTIVIGMRKRAAGLPVRYEISGPGPSGPVPAASTRIEMLGSSLINPNNSSRRTPSLI